jgi:type IV fimbrial biogenesis protein FimT
MNTRRQYGFTLWELLMTLLVAGILLGIGVPNVMEFQRNGAMTAVANDAVTAVLVARTEAVKRQAPVVFCLSANPTDEFPTCSPAAVADSTVGILTDATDNNLTVDADELVLVRSVAPDGTTIRVSTNCSYVSFAPSGFLRQVGATCAPAAPGAPRARALLFCDDRGRRRAAGDLSAARAVQIQRSGRAQVVQEEGQINTSFTIVDLALGTGVPTCPLPP